VTIYLHVAPSSDRHSANVFCTPTETCYKAQTMQIKWGKHLSEPFHVSNGVIQRGVLSPYLFAAYLKFRSGVSNSSQFRGQFRQI